MSTLRGLLDVRPEERRNTFAAFATLLAITTGHTVLETARDALFLSRLPAAQLPWMYLVIVVLALGLAQIRKVDSKAAILTVLVVAAGVTAGFWLLAVDFGARPWVLYALYVWSGLFASWVMVQFWMLLGRAHTMAQAKRLYGFIGAGAVLGGVVGALGARAALTVIPPREMLLTSAVFFVIAGAPLVALRVPSASRTVEQPRDPDALATMTGANLLRQNAFARRILVVVFVATITVTLIDFLFKARIAKAFPDTRELAEWLSTFYAITNILALVAQLFVGPWIFRTVGVQRALFFFPLLLLLAANGVLVATVGMSLIAAVALKALDGTMRYSVHKTSMELLLVPIPDGTRERIKPIIDLLGSRGGQAVASVTILVLVALGVASPVMVGAFVVALTVLWLAIVITIRGHYLEVFRETLRTGGLSAAGELPELDLGALEMLFAGLNSSRDSEVLGSLDLLAEQHRERLIPALILYHPSREVVLRALDLFTLRGRADFISIADRLNGHPDRDVAAAALRARTVVAPDRKLLEQRLVDSCSQVSATALVALMTLGWIEPEEAERRIRAAIGLRSWQTAVEIARTIRDFASLDAASVTARYRKDTGDQFDEVLIRLAREASSFRDIACVPDAGESATKGEKGGEEPRPPVSRPFNLGFDYGATAIDTRVRLEVAKAMAARKTPAFLPILVGMLNRHELRSTARAAIAAIPGALEFLDEVMNERDFARDVRVHLPRTMVLFDPTAAARTLMSHLLTEQDGAVRFKILRALVRLRHTNGSLALDEDVLRRVLETVLDHAEELHRWRYGLSRESRDEAPMSLASSDPLRVGHHLLLDLVRDKEAHARQRLFLLLQLLYREDFEDIERALRSKNAKAHANGIELIENIVRPPLRGRILALVDVGVAPSTTAAYDDVVREILAKGGNTMRTIAEYRALELGIDASAITGTRPSQPPTIESIGKRLVDRARNLLTDDAARPNAELVGGATRAPA